MYNFQTCGETSKESLSDDDINAICTVYPKAMDPGTCEPVGQTSGGCCSASDPRPEGSLALAGATLLVLMRRRNGSRREPGQVSSNA
jgi:MYXO-CTERM domain-containing protein